MLDELFDTQQSEAAHLFMATAKPVPFEAADHAFKVGMGKHESGEDPAEWALAKSFLEEVPRPTLFFVPTIFRHHFFCPQRHPSLGGLQL